MFYLILLTLFAFLYTKASEKHMLCDSSRTKVWYSICDNINKHSVSASIDPCTFSQGFKFNFSFSWIPRHDLINLHATVDVWYKSLKVNGNVYILCTGTDDVYIYCGTLKGETITLTKEIRFTKIKLEPGVYTIFAQLITVDQEEEIVSLCVNATLLLKK
ncbi:lymphocyte antigen 96 isoform X1 [Microcaecilia unicolor]|uniref:Lymphocyte antigen 96 isoform X1 n=1 Tax=Microcaecilia unicolor TaxID=1415580 RepID=A0A6P7Z7X1_9AMPH|nr:lymphocyte antigen 96 isoform X1 [Microcaecilia unicolor]